MAENKAGVRSDGFNSCKLGIHMERSYTDRIVQEVAQAREKYGTTEQNLVIAAFLVLDYCVQGW